MTITKHKIFFGAILSIITAIASFNPTFALTQYLQISPTSDRIDLKPGQKYSGTVTVSNIGEDELTYTMQADPFSPVGEQYDLDFQHKSDANQIVDWFTFSKDSGTLGPNEHEEVGYTITVPENAPAGGQYMAVLAVNDGKNNSSSREGANIKTVSRAATLLYTKVDGEINECAKILNNSTAFILFAPPITANSTVENCGNIHLDAEYSLKVYPLFSDEEIYPRSREEETKKKIVIPGTSRFHASSWTEDKGAPSFGIFNVEHTVKIADQEDTIKQMVIIFPLWLIIVFIALIGAIIFWLVSRAQKRKQARRGN